MDNNNNNTNTTNEMSTAKQLFIAVIMIAIFAAIIYFLFLKASKPEGFTDDEYEKSKKVIELIEDFLAGDISGIDAASNIELIADQLSESEQPKVCLISSYSSDAAKEIAKYALDSKKEHLTEIKECKEQIESYLKKHD